MTAEHELVVARLTIGLPMIWFKSAVSQWEASYLDDSWLQPCGLFPIHFLNIMSVDVLGRKVWACKKVWWKFGMIENPQAKPKKGFQTIH